MSIKRTISKSDLMRAIDGDGEFAVLAEGQTFVVLRWSDGEENAVFNLVRGEITVGAPTGRAITKMNELAGIFNADVIGEDDDSPVQPGTGADDANNSATWIGWPILVVALIVLLIWRW